MEIKHFNNFDMTNESIGTRRFPLTCEYNAMSYGPTPGTTVIKLRKTDGSNEEFFKDVEFLKKLSFVTTTVNSIDFIIEINISKEATMKLLESYIMMINNV